MANARAAQLIRIARLRRFVAVFARGGDVEATAEALTELVRVDRAGGLTGDALRRARQAAELLAGEDSGEAGVRALLHLGSVCLETGEPGAAASAAEIASARAAALDEPIRSALAGCAALLAGIAHGMVGEDEAARAHLDHAREQLVAADQPEGAALALTQQGLLDLAAGHVERAQVCFTYARNFYRASAFAGAVAEVTALAARSLASAECWQEADRWFGEAVAEADHANSPLDAAELAIEHVAVLEQLDARELAIEVATDAARRGTELAGLPGATAVTLRARLVLARLAAEVAESLRHLEAAFELALDQRDPEQLGSALELVVTGLVGGRFPPASWRLVDRFRERLIARGYPALAATAQTALVELRELAEPAAQEK